MRKRPNFKPLIAAGVTLGIGMGGFLNDVLLHQMFWDGLFHAFAWVTIMTGLVFLWRAIRRKEVPRSGRALTGSMIVGWGIFNLVEGMIAHHLLQTHHVFQRASQSEQLYWDLSFLLFGGIFLIVLGQWMINREKKRILVSFSEIPSIRSVA